MSEPFSAFYNYMRNGCESFDIINNRWISHITCINRDMGTVAGFSPVSFERFDKAVSSPHTYAPDPSLISISKLKSSFLKYFYRADYLFSSFQDNPQATSTYIHIHRADKPFPFSRQLYIRQLPFHQKPIQDIPIKEHGL